MVVARVALVSGSALSERQPIFYQVFNWYSRLLFQMRSQKHDHVLCLPPMISCMFGCFYAISARQISLIYHQPPKVRQTHPFLNRTIEPVARCNPFRNRRCSPLTAKSPRKQGSSTPETKSSPTRPAVRNPVATSFSPPTANELVLTPKRKLGESTAPHPTCGGGFTPSPHGGQPIRTAEMRSNASGVR